MSSIAAFLRKHNCLVELCLLERGALDNTDRLFKDIEQHPIAIAKPNFKDFKEMFSFLKEAKARGQFKRVFFCGPFAALNSQNMIARVEWLDGIIEGEPEETCLELLNSLSPDFAQWNFSCKGGVWRDPRTGKIHTLGKRQLAIPLDDFPFPARDIEKNESTGYVNMEMGRGCYYNCSFCHVPAAHSQTDSARVRVRNPVKVVDEIELINKLLGKTLFIFNDSVFWGGPVDDKRILEFCNEIKKRKLNIHFYAYLRCSPWPNEEVFSAMVDAGLVRVFLGVENSSEATLKIYNKRIKNNDYETIKKQLDDKGVNIHIGYITFQPFSTLDEISSNICYLHKIGKLFRLGVILEGVRVIPGLSMHQQLIKSGLMAENLNFDQLTYGYSYKYPEVGKLYQGIKMMFEKNLEKTSYALEYYCVSGQLAKSIAKRLKKECAPLDPIFKEFDQACANCNDLLLKYFEAVILQAKQGCSTHEIASQESHNEFIHAFRSETLRMEILWGLLRESIRKHVGERVLREVFTGVERT